MPSSQRNPFINARGEDAGSYEFKKLFAIRSLHWLIYIFFAVRKTRTYCSTLFHLPVLLSTDNVVCKDLSCIQIKLFTNPILLFPEIRQASVAVSGRSGRCWSTGLYTSAGITLVPDAFLFFMKRTVSSIFFTEKNGRLSRCCHQP